MANRFLRTLLSIPIVVLIFVATFVNVKIHYSPEFKVTSSDTINCDLLRELRGLKDAMLSHADIEMQNVYPEGFVFLNALYGLAWCNFIVNPRNDPNKYFNEGHHEIQNAWGKINSDIGRAPFREELPLAYGAFYTGWSTYLLGKKLSIEKKEVRDANEIALFKQQCERINAAIAYKTYPLSYDGGAWPADAVVCIATLSLHDRLLPSKYAASIKIWINKVKTTLDPHGLIPHAVNSVNDEPTEAARGSSQSLMLIFLKDIDSEFAQEQFKIYKTNFLDDRFGLPGIREYFKGEHGVGDIDSGPVIFQLGSAATIVGMKTMGLYHEQSTAIEIRNMLEGFGFPMENQGNKTYLFGLMPMADVFIAWGHSTLGMSQTKTDFRWFHIYSLVLILILSSMLWLLLRHSLARSQPGQIKS